MAELKTKPTEQSVEQFLQGVSPEQKRRGLLHPAGTDASDPLGGC